MNDRRQRGGVVVLLVVALVLVLASAGAAALSAAATAAQRERTSERALAQAREALIAHAADRPIDARVGPGYLPCPDLDDDGWAEATCGSLDGRLGQSERLGRLPWKTLGLPDLRDGSGERLWYAVSARHKGLLNCAASPGCVDMTPPAALGTISVRDAAGTVLHDGRVADPGGAATGGAAAVVIAPGPAIVRSDGHAQRRDCPPGDCDPQGRCLAEPPARAARCDPRNYLDAAPFEDNAAFVDRTDARGANTDGFVLGPVTMEGRVLVNDRIATLAYADVTSRVMTRVALEVAWCLRMAVAGSEGGKLPAPVQACGSNAHVGHVPVEKLASLAACSARPGEPAWWTSWAPHVLYARGAPSGLDVVAPGGGPTLLPARRFAVLVTQRPRDCTAAAVDCGDDGCVRIVQPARSRERHDALVASH